VHNATFVGKANPTSDNFIEYVEEVALSGSA